MTPIRPVDLDSLAAALTDQFRMSCEIETGKQGHRTLYATRPRRSGHVTRRWVITDYGILHLGAESWGRWGDSGLIIHSDWPLLRVIEQYLFTPS
jgi:hypothetical protein